MNAKYTAQVLAATKTGAVHALCQGVAPEACAATRAWHNGCASIGPRHREARISTQM